MVFSKSVGHNDKYEGHSSKLPAQCLLKKKHLLKRPPWVEKVSFATGEIFTDIDFSYRGVSVISE